MVPIVSSNKCLYILWHRVERDGGLALFILRSRSTILVVQITCSNNTLIPISSKDLPAHIILYSDKKDDAYLSSIILQLEKT